MHVFASLSRGARGITRLVPLFSLALLTAFVPPVLAAEEHAAAEGLVLFMGGQPIVTQWEGVVTGEIAVHHEEITDPIEVFFLDIDSTLFQPDLLDHELRVIVADELATLATVNAGTWTFTVGGLLEGISSLQVVIWHDGHADFTSLPIEVHVEEHGTHSVPEGLLLMAGASELARQWEGVLSGGVFATVGSTTAPVEVFFLDLDGVTFVPEGVDFEMRWIVGDESIATLEAVGAWTFVLHGHAEGSTTVNLVIWHDGHADFTSMDVPVSISATTAAPGTSVTRVALRPAMPNPFTSNTSIRYALPARTPVEVSVYDARGRLVQTLFDGVREAGEHAEIFDAGPSGAGVYFVRLNTPEQTQTIKLIHVR